MKQVVLAVCLVSSVGRADSLVLNSLAHGCIGYLIGSTVSDKIGKGCQPRSVWKGTAETIILSCLFSIAWDQWRPETDRREFRYQAVSLQVGAQIGLRF